MGERLLPERLPKGRIGSQSFKQTGNISIRSAPPGDGDQENTEKGKMKKKKTISQLKKRCWEVFSIYIRRKYADQNGFVLCVTCRKSVPWSEAQASHYVPGRTNSILFDERGVYPCCFRCNVILSGNLHQYTKFLESVHGIEGARNIREELILLSKQPRKFSAEELKDLIKHYKSITINTPDA